MHRLVQNLHAKMCTLVMVALVGLLALAATRGDTSFTRIVIIGASMSDGFGVRVSTTLEDGRKISEGVNMAALVKAASKDSSVLVANFSTSLYFMNPASIARSSVARAIATKPTCVMAVDWLFWNGYGTHNVNGAPLTTDQERMELLENALQQLEPWCASDIPIVLGDFPDMHSAIGGGMISAEMVPSIACITALNKRVAEWSSTRKNVDLVPLSTLTKDLLEKKIIQAAGREWSQEKLGPLLQKDRLHPTFAGTVTVFAAMLDALNRSTNQSATQSFEIDPNILREGFIQKLRKSAAKNDSQIPAAASADKDRVPSVSP